MPGETRARPSVMPDDPTDALQHWLAQEGSPVRDDLADPPEDERDGSMAAGWWILPLIALSLPCWVALWLLLSPG